MTSSRTLSRNDYTIGWISALPIERAAAKSMLDEVHPDVPVGLNDHNAYTLGRVGNHNLVIACLPTGEYGIASAATVTVQLLSSFPSIRLGFMVGIGGGVPNSDADIRLGDIVVSKPTSRYGGVVQYDYGKALNGSFERTGVLNRPPQVILTALAKLQANHLTEDSRIPEFLSQMTARLGRKRVNFARPGREDRLYQSDYDHIPAAKTCDLCDETKILPRPLRDNIEPVIHYGLIASGNQVVKDSHIRDLLGRELGVYCVEMEAAGLMNNFPCLVIRGICDYADSHKNKEWQGYAAAAAAAFAKELLLAIPMNYIKSTPAARDSLSHSENFNISFDLSNIPAVEQFVGRDEDLAHLWNQLRPDASHTRKIVVIHGLGGIGKTQLAIRFARLHRDDFSTIFWLDGKNKDTLLRSLASVLPKLPGVPTIPSLTANEEIEQQAHEVSEWLAITNNSKWLLIFDNVDKYSLTESFENEAYDVTSFFPHADHGSIIVTTRISQLAEIGQSYAIQKLPSDEAATLLINSTAFPNVIAEKSSVHSDLLALAQRLDGLPLALVTAGSYIRRTGVSPSKYLELYSRSWRELQEVAQPHKQYSNGNLTATWMISYEEIQRDAPFAAKLLLLLACYDNGDIWYDLVRQGLHTHDESSWLFQVASKEINFFRAMEALLSFSLVQPTPSSGSYSLHPVMQDWCRGYMREEGLEEEMVDFATVSIGLSVVSIYEPRSWISHQRLLPHANRIYQLLQNRTSLTIHPAVLHAVNNIGILFSHRGKLQEAERMFQLALASYENALGSGRTVTFTIGNPVEDDCFAQDQLQDSHKMVWQGLAANEITFSIDRTSTLDTINNLGNIYVDQGRLQQAEDMLLKALAGYEEALGADHAFTLDALNNLARLYSVRGSPQQAEDLYHKARAGYERTLGSDHISTLRVINNLGFLYEMEGRLKEAEQLFRQALVGMEERLGADHISTLRIVHGLGQLYHDQGRLQEAETMYQRALIGFEEVLGPDHDLTVQVAKVLRSYST